MSHKLVSLYIGDGEYYTRTDADNVIANRDCEIQKLNRQIKFLKTTHDACGNCNKCADGMGKVFDENLDKLKDKALQYKVLYKELCRDINTQERHFALQVNYQKFKRCLAMAKMLEHICPRTIRKAKWKGKWHMLWLELAEKFKPNNSTAQ